MRLFVDSRPKSTVYAADTDRISTITVPTAEIKADGAYHFTVHLKKYSGIKHIIDRTYNDFWALQVALLNHHPSESGRKRTPRIIPFLTAPPKEWTPTLIQQRRTELDRYLQELIRMSLNLVESLAVKRFFLLRDCDIETTLDVDFDVTGTLMDLISDYQDDEQIKIRVVYKNEVISWSAPESITYGMLLKEVRQNVTPECDRIGYVDECNELTLLHGDRDLRLLTRTYASKLLLHIME